jgi:hypothetical protein
MSPISQAIETLAEQTGADVLDVQELFLERAAIRQYDGGMTKTDAEREAVEDCRVHFTRRRR